MAAPNLFHDLGQWAREQAQQVRGYVMPQQQPQGSLLLGTQPAMQPGLFTQEDQAPFWPPLAPMGKGKGTGDEQQPFWPSMAKGKGKGVAPPQMERLVP